GGAPAGRKVRLAEVLAGGGRPSVWRPLICRGVIDEGPVTIAALEQLDDGVDGDDPGRFETQHRPVAAPSPMFRTAAEARAHWVSRDVAQHLEHVGVAFDQHRAVATLEEMALALV